MAPILRSRRTTTTTKEAKKNKAGKKKNTSAIAAVEVACSGVEDVIGPVQPDTNVCSTKETSPKRNCSGAEDVNGAVQAAAAEVI